MRLLFLLSTLLILSACMNTPEAPLSKDEKSTNKIICNKTEAQDAQNEYKNLQAQRGEE